MTDEVGHATSLQTKNNGCARATVIVVSPSRGQNLATPLSYKSSPLRKNRKCVETQLKKKTSRIKQQNEINFAKKAESRTGEQDKVPMKDYVEIKSSKRVNFLKIPTILKSGHKFDKKFKHALSKNHDQIEEFQTLLYAERSRGMLIIFQGMDTAGKDGAIKHVMSGVNPQGCSVVSFKTPTSIELNHDFLWRANRALPLRGQIGIFNRSYYEEALITRVHPELIEAEKLPTGKEHGDLFWKGRYTDISNYERYLHRQGYEIIKIFIHISKDVQKQRLTDRFSDPDKQWKISESDYRERSFWKEYQKAYEECIGHTASKHSPWYIVAGDNKKRARLSISQILVDRFEKMKLAYPKLKADEKKQLKIYQDLLVDKSNSTVAGKPI